MGTRYDHPNAIVRREVAYEIAAGTVTTQAAATAKFAMFQKGVLKKAHASIVVAGTSANLVYNVFVGTTSVGTIAAGTTAALGTASSGALDTAVPALTQISIRTVGDATGKAIIVYEYEVDHDATQS
jgi:hypothetical protein